MAAQLAGDYEEAYDEAPGQEAAGDGTAGQQQGASNAVAVAAGTCTRTQPVERRRLSLLWERLTTRLDEASVPQLERSKLLVDTFVTGSMHGLGVCSVDSHAHDC